MLVGIDPGFSGAIALLDPVTGKLAVHDMPTAPNPKGRNETDLHGLARLLAPTWEGRSIAMLEFVAARPGQGVASMFRFGQHYGTVQMALAGHGYEVHYVTPQLWKKHFKLSKDKGVSRGLASRRFPANSESYGRVKDDGRAEASLIALYGLETLNRLKA